MRRHLVASIVRQQVTLYWTAVWDMGARTPAKICIGNCDQTITDNIMDTTDSQQDIDRCPNQQCHHWPHVTYITLAVIATTAWSLVRCHQSQHTGTRLVVMWTLIAISFYPCLHRTSTCQHTACNLLLVLAFHYTATDAAPNLTETAC